jgi:predicted RNase H-like HicB family nuclease
LKTRPYPLTIERESDGGYVVADDVTLVYGCGDTLDAALADYDASLAEWRAITARNSPSSGFAGTTTWLLGLRLRSL